MELDFGNNAYMPIQAIIQQIIFNDNLLQKLRATDVIINALDENIAEKTNAKAFQKFIHSIFEDTAFIRRLTYLSYIKTNIETALEYTGYDYISNPDFHYDETMEKKMQMIEKRLAKFLGNILKELNKGEDIEL